MHSSSADRPSALLLTPLIGREREVEAVCGLLTDSPVRLLTLTGPGGIGKTRLALAAAERLQEQFPDCISVVMLASLDDPRFVIPTIAAALAVTEQPDTPLIDLLINRIADQRRLLLIDNFEHVSNAAGDISMLLAGCPQLTVLATSRTPLHLYGEQEYPVPALDSPVYPSEAPEKTIASADAVTLFVERARAVQPAFSLTEENAQLIAEICRKLDGLPLAIELAAARVRLFSPAELLARLEHPLGLLTGGPRDLPARQQSLRATIAWSYSLLQADDQRLFRALSAFPGGWILEAAAAVAGAESETDILPGLDHLVDQNLVRLRRQADDQSRYVMLATIREFGLEELERYDEIDEVRQRQAAQILDVFSFPEFDPYGPLPEYWMARAELELDNVRSILGWAVEHDAESALRICYLFSPVWWRTSRDTEGSRWMLRALDSDHPASQYRRFSGVAAIAIFRGPDPSLTRKTGSVTGSKGRPCRWKKPSTTRWRLTMTPKLCRRLPLLRSQRGNPKYCVCWPMARPTKRSPRRSTSVPTRPPTMWPTS